MNADSFVSDDNNNKPLDRPYSKALTARIVPAIMALISTWILLFACSIFNQILDFMQVGGIAGLFEIVGKIMDEYRLVLMTLVFILIVIDVLVMAHWEKGRNRKSRISAARLLGSVIMGGFAVLLWSVLLLTSTYRDNYMLFLLPFTIIVLIVLGVFAVSVLELLAGPEKDDEEV